MLNNKISKSLLLSLIFITASLLGGCAASYKSKDVWGGYAEARIDENVFHVSFKGNTFTSRERVNDFSLLRSAEVALENGYDYFVVLDQQRPGTKIIESTQFGSPSMSSYAGRAGPSREVSGGRKTTVSNPVTETLIACFTEKPETVNSFNASELVRSIKSKYELES